MIYAFFFAIIALIAALFGFEVVSVLSPAIARVVCYGALALSVFFWAWARFGVSTPYWEEARSSPPVRPRRSELDGSGAPLEAPLEELSTESLV